MHVMPIVFSACDALLLACDNNTLSTVVLNAVLTVYLWPICHSYVAVSAKYSQI
jgi:hypothetical protein